MSDSEEVIIPGTQQLGHLVQLVQGADAEAATSLAAIITADNCSAAVEAGACEALAAALQCFANDKQQRKVATQCLLALQCICSPTANLDQRVAEHVGRLAECAGIHTTIAGLMHAPLAAPAEGDAELIAAACFVMGCLCKGKGGRAMCVSAGACQLLPRALAAHLDSIGVVRTVCQVIGILSHFSKAELVEAGVCQPLIDALQRHSACPVVAEAVCWTIICFGRESDRDDEAIALLIQAGALKAVVKALSQHLVHPELAACVCFALRALDMFGEHGLLLGEAGAVYPLMELLTNFDSHPIEAVRAAGIIMKTICVNKTSSEMIAATGACRVAVRVLLQFISDAELAGTMCVILAKAGPSASSGRLEWAETAAAALTKVLQLHISDERTSVSASWAIQAVMEPFGVDEPQPQFVTTDKTAMCDALLKAMQAHAGVPFNIREGFAAIAILCDNPDFVAHFLQPEICGWLMEALRSLHSVDGIMIVAVCDMIHPLCRAEGGADILAACGVCEILIAALQEFMESGPVVEAACRQLLAFAAAGQSARLAELGACELVCTVFREHRQDPIVAHAALVFVGRLGMENAPNAERMALAGVCGLVVDAMNLHGHHNHARFMEVGCEVVRVLLSHDDNAGLFLEADAVPVLTQALQQRLDDFSSVLLLCWIFRQLLIFAADHPDRDIPFAPLARPVIQALARHARDPELAFIACGGLVCVPAHSTPETDLAAAMLQACEPVLQAVEIHRTDMQAAQIVQFGCFALVNLTAEVPNARLLCQAGACNTIARVFQSWTHDRSVMQPALSIVVNLTMHSNNSTALLGTLGVCVSVTVALRLYVQTLDLAWRACAAIANLARNDDNKGILGRAGACQVVLQALARHMQADNVANAAMDAVAQLGLHVDNCAQLADGGACELVLEALSFHFSGRATAEKGYNALLTLSFGNDMRHRPLLAAAGMLETLNALHELHDFEDIEHLIQEFSIFDEENVAAQ